MSSLPPVWEFITELTCIGVDCVLCGILFALYRATNKTITTVRDASTIDIHDNEDFADVVTRHKDAEKNTDGDWCVPYAVIRGKVFPMSSSLPSQLCSEAFGEAKVQDVPKGVIRKHIVTEHKRILSRSGFWYDSERTIQEHVNDVPFCLLPTWTEEGIIKGKGLWNVLNPNKRSDLISRTGVEVTDWWKARRVDLDVTKDVFESASGGFGDHLVGWLVGDRQTGVQTQESMLLEGATVTAIGELVVPKNQGPTSPKVRIQPPSSGYNYYLVKDSADALVKDLERRSTAVRYALFGFGALTLGIVCYTGYMCYRRFQHIKSNREAENRWTDMIERRRLRRRDQPESIASSDVNSSQRQRCVVCLSEELEVIFHGCQHICCCADCAVEIANRDAKCPVCRSTIASMTPAYIA